MTRASAMPSGMLWVDPQHHRAAGQTLTLVALEVHQRELRGRAQFKLTVQHLHLARGAEAVTAGMRQPHARAQAGIEDGLAFASLDRMPQRLDGDSVAHTP